MSGEQAGGADTDAPCLCEGTCVGYECTKRRSVALCNAAQFTKARALLEFAIARDETDDRLKDMLRFVYNAKMEHNARPSPNADSADVKPDDLPQPLPAKRRRLVGEPAEPQEPPETAANAEPSTPPASDATLSSAKLRILHEHFCCTICAELLFEPVTTPCGHTFCRDCLCRAVDFTDTCPTCRTVLHIEDPAQLPVTNLLRDAIQTCFPAEYEERRRSARAETPTAENTMSRLPLFPLNAVVFPRMCYPMHVFEARYRLMLRRILVGSRKFGLIALKRTPEGGSELCDVGCVLEVTKAERYPDGRSLIETVARERFKLLARTEVDGYLVGRTEVFEDTEGVDTDEAREVENNVRAIMDRLLERGVKLPGIAGNVPSREQGPAALGMWLAGVLVSDHNGRQALLEMQNSTARLREMLSYLERFRDAVQANAQSGNTRECSIQ